MVIIQSVHMIDFGVNSFMLYAILAGFAVAITSGSLGCVIVWRRMAYFGDTVSHAALLGVVMALVLQWLPAFGVVLTGVIVTSILFWLERKRELSTDTLLGILSHSALAIGMVVLALLQSVLPRFDVMSILFGDILAIGEQELLTLYIGCACVMLVYSMLWRKLISLSAHEDLARIDGVDVMRTKYVFMLLLAVVIAFAIKVVGVLLITALLIIPAASARLFAHSPLQMLLLSIVVALLSVMLGFTMSLQWDLPTGPAIVVAAAIFFIVSRSVSVMVIKHG